MAKWVARGGSISGLGASKHEKPKPSTMHASGSSPRIALCGTPQGRGHFVLVSLRDQTDCATCRALLRTEK